MATSDDQHEGDEQTVARATPTPPHLASLALMDDVAPVEPYRRLMRGWCGLSGLLLTAIAILSWLDPTRALATELLAAEFALAAVALLAAALPLPYTVRALLALLVGAAALAAGVADLGPIAPLAEALGPWSLLHTVAATALPAALLFRAHYRAYAAARSILAMTLVLALPFVAYCILSLSRDGLAVQIASGIALALLAPSLLGFMGAETTIGGQYVAALVIIGASGQIGTQALTTVWASLAEQTPLALLGAIASFPVLTTLAALAVFQLLAWRHWDDARAHSRRAPPTSRAPLISLGDSWSSRR